MIDVTLIYARGANGHLCYGDKPIGWHPQVSPSTRALDQAILRRVLREKYSGKCAAVMTRNCAEELEKAPKYLDALDKAVKAIIVTSRDRVALSWLDNPDELEVYTKHSKDKDSWHLERIMALAIDHDFTSLLILGGPILYERFLPLADEIHETTFHAATTGSGHFVDNREGVGYSVDYGELTYRVRRL